MPKFKTNNRSKYVYVPYFSRKYIGPCIWMSPSNLIPPGGSGRKIQFPNIQLGYKHGARRWTYTYFMYIIYILGLLRGSIFPRIRPRIDLSIASENFERRNPPLPTNHLLFKIFCISAKFQHFLILYLHWFGPTSLYLPIFVSQFDQEFVRRYPKSRESMLKWNRGLKSALMHSL